MNILIDADGCPVVDLTLQIAKQFSVPVIILCDTCASLMVMNGVPMKQIQEWLGHSTFSTTADIYAHLDYASKLSSAQAMLEGLGYGNASA